MVEQKAKLQQQEAEPKRAERTRMAALKCATDKKFPHLSRTKSVDVPTDGKTTDTRINDFFTQRLHQVREMKDSMRKRMSLCRKKS